MSCRPILKQEQLPTFGKHELSLGTSKNSPVPSVPYMHNSSSYILLLKQVLR